jgi:hypothetical protein
MSFDYNVKKVAVLNAANIGHTFADSVLNLPGEFCWAGVIQAAQYFYTEWGMKVVIVVTQSLWE